MVYNSYVFCMFFTAVWFVLWLIRQHGVRKIILLIASFTFYGWWDPRFILLILLSIAIDYACGLSIERWRNRRRLFLYLSLLTNLGILAYFKYFFFFSSLLGLEGMVRAIHIILPIGISFYTFQSMSYTIDVYRKKIPACKNPIDFALFVTFFPQLVAGPIVRAGELIPQLASPYELTIKNIERGLPYFLAGLVCKVVIADSLSPFVIERFSDNAPNAAQMLLSGQLYMVMLYYDFAGYSLMAIGLGRCLGIYLPQNFRSPFAADSIAEFWQKWHVSLGLWLRDYVFRPAFQWIEPKLKALGLGLKQRSFAAYAFAVILLMSVMGLWHGAHMSYVLHGFFYGLLIVVDRALFQNMDKRARTNPKHPPFAIYILTRRLFVYWIFGASALLFYYTHIPAPETYFSQPFMRLSQFNASDAIVFTVALTAFFVQNISRDEDIILKTLQGRWAFPAAIISLLALFYVKTEPVQYVYFQF